ncbi:PREDICTED: agamous-like MADS-box protein AGL62 [Lupinus angustifolius]|uniref:agamous-like MADS-box protein AGL62 n=1 Tax=Lupinus angustifolius TaxID=3871 RepID=UPI00092FCBF0|nr:PREDICTED: agamous-like MADS-box protein AGL62 [Lupinus angustifolius]
MVNSVSNSNPRRSKGRQKIEMKKMTNESNLQVTFSKRRSGLFKKASELCTLCGVEVALIVFSPGEKVFSFGHPNVDTVIDRYMMRAPPQNLGTMQFIEAHRSANVRELNAQLTQINADLEIEKKCSDELNRLHTAAKSQFWWAAPIDEMNNTQLDQFKLALKELKKGLSRQGSAATQPPQFFPGASNSNNPMLLHQPQCPPQPQMFPLTTQQMPHHPSMMMFDGGMMRYPGFNNIGGFGQSGGFF